MPRNNNNFNIITSIVLCSDQKKNKIIGNTALRIGNLATSPLCGLFMRYLMV